MALRMQGTARISVRLGAGAVNVGFAIVFSAAVLAGAPARAEGISWQEAVARLVYERSQAESCVRLLKQFGDKVTVDRESIAYNQAKTEYDAVISGLIVVLAQRQEPDSLASLQERLQRGFDRREAFCNSMQPLVPASNGKRGLVDEIVSGTIGPVVDAVKEIYLDHRKEDALLRGTIQTQLEDSRWPDFASVSP